MVSSVENEAGFSFTCVTVDDISKEIQRLDIKKATQESDIPTKVIKQFSNLFIHFLHKNINSCLTEGAFSNDFKKVWFITAMVPCSRIIWITNSSDHRRV